MTYVGRPVYRTMFLYGCSRTICSEHRTFSAAQRAARKCEAEGGSRHWVEKVQRVKWRRS